MADSSALSRLKKSSVYAPVRRYLGPFLIPLKFRYLQNRYARHSYAKSFAWDWGRINFNRIALVNLLVSQRPDCAYLEIGTADNSLFNSIPALNKVGVDPNNGGTVRKTSDDFFRTNESLFDVVFIDGLHTYDQVRRDAANSIRCLKPGGYIAFHDMLPRNWKESHVPIVSPGAWTGDVWKAAFELTQTEGLDFRVLRIDCGVGVLRITGNKPALVDLRSELVGKQFSYFYENIARLPIVEWKDAQDWLRSS
ncbi:MAG: class I SAM-dependent methyltransferase [Actinomycetes bacterium]